MPRKKANIPANETPEARFVRVATERTNRMLTSLKQLAGLGNTSQYKSTAAQRTQISEALTAALKKSIDAMGAGGETVQEFKLK